MRQSCTSKTGSQQLKCWCPTSTCQMKLCFVFSVNVCRTKALRPWRKNCGRELGAANWGQGTWDRELGGVGNWGQGTGNPVQFNAPTSLPPIPVPSSLSQFPAPSSPSPGPCLPVLSSQFPVPVPCPQLTGGRCPLVFQKA